MDQEIKDAIANIERRKKEIKLRDRIDRKLTESVKKAAHQAPSMFDSYHDKEMHYSEKEVQDWIKGTSYYETYQAIRAEESDWN